MGLFATQPGQQQKNTKKTANIGGDDISTNQEGIPVPYLAGVGRLSVNWMTPVYNPTTKAVKTPGSKLAPSQTTGYKYFGDLAGYICFGPLDVIYAIIIDNNIAWPTVKNIDKAWSTGGLWRTPGQDYVSITIPKYGQCWLYWGTETQQPSQNVILKPRGTAPSDPGFDPRDPSTWPFNPAQGGQQTFDSLASGDANPRQGHYDSHPDYLGIVLMLFQQLHFGENRNAAPSISVIVGRSTSWFGGGATTLDLAGVHPAGPIYEVLTNGRYGGEFTDPDLGQTSFQSLATALAQFPLSPLITQKTKHKDFLVQMMQYYDGWLHRNGAVIEAGYFQHGNIGTNFPHLNSDDFTSEPELKSTGFGDTFNYFSAIYNNRHRYFKTDVERYTDESNREAVGQTRVTEAQMPWIVDPDIAQKYVTEWGQIQSLPVTTGQIMVKRERLVALGINVGSRFYMDSEALGFSMLMRCLEIEWPKDKDGSAKVSVESERGLWPAIYYPPGVPKDPDFNFGPELIRLYRVIELPLELRDDPNAIEIALLALRPNAQCIGFRIWASVDNTTYFEVSSENPFAAFGMLNAEYANTNPNPDALISIAGVTKTSGSNAIGSAGAFTAAMAKQVIFGPGIPLGTIISSVTDSSHATISNNATDGTTVTAAVGGAQIYLYGVGLDDIVSQTDADRDNGTLLLFIEDEIMSVGQITALGSGLFSVLVRRGMYKTTIQDHAAGAQCWFIFRAAMTVNKNANFIAQNSLYVKLQAHTQQLDEDLADITPFLYTIGERETLAAPSLSPGTQSFSAAFDVTLGIDAGLVARYTLDGTEVRETSAEWPKSGSSYATLHITTGCTLRVKGFAPDGERTVEAIAVYTQVGAGSAGTPTCASVKFSFDGTQGVTFGNLTMSCPTSSSVIKYSVNGGALQVYSAPLAIQADKIVAHGEATGFNNSPDTAFDNSGASAPTTPAPKLWPPPGTYPVGSYGNLRIGAYSALPNALIRMTTDGSTPTPTHGTILLDNAGYQDSVVVISLSPSGNPQPIKLIAYDPTGANVPSAVVSAVYSVNTGADPASTSADPIIQPDPGSYNMRKRAQGGPIGGDYFYNVCSVNRGAQFRATIDGSDPFFGTGASGHGVLFNDSGVGTSFLFFYLGYTQNYTLKVRARVPGLPQSNIVTSNISLVDI